MMCNNPGCGVNSAWAVIWVTSESSKTREKQYYMSGHGVVKWRWETDVIS
jgi:hypothetical protein